MSRFKVGMMVNFCTLDENGVIANKDRGIIVKYNPRVPYPYTIRPVELSVPSDVPDLWQSFILAEESELEVSGWWGRTKIPSIPIHEKL